MLSGLSEKSHDNSKSSETGIPTLRYFGQFVRRGEGTYMGCWVWNGLGQGKNAWDMAVLRTAHKLQSDPKLSATLWHLMRL